MMQPETKKPVMTPSASFASNEIPMRLCARETVYPEQSSEEFVSTTATTNTGSIEETAGNKDPNLIIPDKEIIENSISFGVQPVQQQEKSEKGFNCLHCNREFRTYIALIIHSTRHKGSHVSASSTCKYCEKVLCTKAELFEHIRTQHGCDFWSITAKSQACPKCGRICRDQQRLHSHIRNQHENRRVPVQKPLCDRCGQILPSLKRLEAHIRGQHYKVNVAGKHPSDRSKLFATASNKRRRTRSKAVSCPYCSKAFRDRYSLQRHMVVHTKEKAYQCEQCMRSFVSSDSLRTHSKRHRHRDYQCKDCPLKFRLRRDLRNHVINSHRPEFKVPSTNISHSPMPVQTKVRAGQPCQQCSKVFPLCKLQRHLISHSEERNFKCTACDKAFKYPDHLRRHQKKSRGCPIVKLTSKHLEFA